MLRLDAGFKAHLGLTIARRSRARDRCLKRAHRATDMGQPKDGTARDALHKSGPRAAAPLETPPRLRNGQRHSAGLDSRTD
jgi:hypothetical protein